MGLLAVAVVVCVPRAGAQTLVTLGQQDFTDGLLFYGVGEFNSASASEPAPFDQFYGGDVDGPNFSADWTFDYQPRTQISEAAITFGIHDHDSLASGLQVAFFGVDGFDLTSGLNAEFESRGGANGEYNVYTLRLPVGAFASLLDGTATFTLMLSAPGYGTLGNTMGNGAGLDFATLSIAAVPEPATTGLLLLGFGGLWLVVSRRKK